MQGVVHLIELVRGGVPLDGSHGVPGGVQLFLVGDGAGRVQIIVVQGVDEHAFAHANIVLTAVGLQLDGAVLPGIGPQLAQVYLISH